MVERRAEAERAAAANARERQSLAEQLQLEVWARQEADERAAEAERRAAEAGAAQREGQQPESTRERQRELTGGRDGLLAKGTQNGELGTPLACLKADEESAPLSPPTPPIIRA